MHALILIISLFFYQSLWTYNASYTYSKLNLRSLSELTAFYQLYPKHVEHKAIEQRILSLLEIDQDNLSAVIKEVTLLSKHLPTLVESIINYDLQTLYFDKNQIKLLKKIMGSHLGNRKLKGYNLLDIEDLNKLDSPDIDLSRALLMIQFGPNQMELIQTYELIIDLMALQIKASLAKNPSPKAIIQAINNFLFFDMNFRFPPNSIWEENIANYTFLPALIQSKQGVCLGTSSLYLSIAQRLALPLEIVTPPGHIYLRYRNGQHVINIETTSRGINIATKYYLNVNTKYLPTRSIKEVIGLTLINQASGLLQKQQYEEAKAQYIQSLLYLTRDPLANKLLAYTYLLTKEEKPGLKLLKNKALINEPYLYSQSTIPQDLLSKKLSIDGLKTLLIPHKQTIQSIQAREESLKKCLALNPQSVSLIFELASLSLHKGMINPAIEYLEAFHQLYSNDVLAEYTLCTLYYESFNYPKAWQHLRQTQNLIKIHTIPLTQIQNKLSSMYPSGK